MTKQVKLAIFDRDLKAREYKNFNVTDDGSKIRVRTGGKKNFNPTLDNDSFIEFPYRSLGSPWKVSWKRVYFARNGAKACVRFRRTPTGLKLMKVGDLQELVAKTQSEDPEEALKAQKKLDDLLTLENTQDYLMPDPTQVMEAVGTDLLKSLGKEKTETPIIQYIILALLLLITLNQLGVIV